MLLLGHNEGETRVELGELGTSPERASDERGIDLGTVDDALTERGLLEPEQNVDDAVVDDPTAGRATSSLAAFKHEVRFGTGFLVREVVVLVPAVASLHDVKGSDGFEIVGFSLRIEMGGDRVLESEVGLIGRTQRD